MRMMGWLMAKTFRNTFRKKSSWLIFFGLPLVGVFISMLLYGNNSDGKLRVGIVNADSNQAITQDAIQFVSELSQAEVTLVDDAAMRADISAGKLDSGIRFEKGFADSLRAGEPDHVEIVSIKGVAVTAYVRSTLENYSANVAQLGQASKGDIKQFNQLYASYQEQPFKLVTNTLKDRSNSKAVTYQSIGFLILFMMFSASNMNEFILKEKENRTFLRLLSSPLNARTIVLANVAVSLIIVFLQILLTLFFMKQVFKIDSGIPFGELLVALLLFALAAIGLALLIVSFAKNSSSAGALQNLIITPTCLLAGCYFPLEIMPDTVRKIANFLPQHWVLQMVDQLQHGASFRGLYLNMAILLAFAAAFSLIAIFRFSRNNDTRTFI